MFQRKTSREVRILQYPISSKIDAGAVDKFISRELIFSKSVCLFVSLSLSLSIFQLFSPSLPFFALFFSRERET